MTDADSLALLFNGLITFGAGLPLGYVYFKKGIHLRAFALWITGFMVYGLQLFARFFLAIPLSDITVVLANIVAFAFFVLGTSILLEQLRKFMILFMPFVGVALIFYVLGFPTLSAALGVVGLYGSMAYGSFIIARRLGKLAVRFFAGWTLLFVSNLLIAVPVPLAAVNLLAGASKVVIALGMLEQKFTTSLLRLSRYHTGLVKPDVSQKGELMFVIGSSHEGDKKKNMAKLAEKEIDWVNKHLRDLATERLLTHVIVRHGSDDKTESKDLALASALEDLASIYGMVLIKLVPHPKSTGEKEPKKPLTVEIGDDPVDFIGFLSNLFRACHRAEISTEIIIPDLSWLTAGLGEEEVLSYLIAQTTTLQTSNIVLTCLLHPGLDSDQFIESCKRFGNQTIEL
ncbi:MAG: hypothetical protein HYY67_02635 [Thaumarchaeota archaeon]|nr:hypothetical protein [Nitrososphaerota archaeon]